MKIERIFRVAPHRDHHRHQGRVYFARVVVFKKQDASDYVPAPIRTRSADPPALVVLKILGPDGGGFDFVLSANRQDGKTKSECDRKEREPKAKLKHGTR